MNKYKRKNLSEYVEEAKSILIESYKKNMDVDLWHEYKIGEDVEEFIWKNDKSGGWESDFIYDLKKRREAIESLSESNFIREIRFMQREESEYDHFDYALCRINEKEIHQNIVARDLDYIKITPGIDENSGNPFININGKRIPLSTGKSEYNVIKFFPDNKTLVASSKFYTKDVGRQAFNGGKRRLNIILKEYNLKIDSERKNRISYYKIYKI